jgi:hypothetical protein
MDSLMVRCLDISAQEVEKHLRTHLHWNHPGRSIAFFTKPADSQSRTTRHHVMPPEWIFTGFDPRAF